MLADKWERAIEKWETSQRPKAGNGGKNLKTCTACVKACEVLLADTRKVAESSAQARADMLAQASEVVESNEKLANLLVKLGREQRIAAALELAGMALVITIFLYCIV